MSCSSLSGSWHSVFRLLLPRSGLFISWSVVAVIMRDHTLVLPATAGNSVPGHHAACKNQVTRKFFEHSNATRVNTDAVIVDAIRAEHPQQQLICVPKQNCDLLGYAAAGHALSTAIGSGVYRHEWVTYDPPDRKIDGGVGSLQRSVLCGKYLLGWHGMDYIMYLIDGRDGTEPYPQVTMQYILSETVDSSEELLMAAGSWTNELHEEIWVFDQGFWEKS